jgi:N-acetylglutamate synthase-like GNAT family acetyltransferase
MQTKIRRTNPSDSIYLDRVYALIEPEMKAGLIAQKTKQEIAQEIKTSQAFFAFNCDGIVGYISIKIWQSCIELMTIVVDPCLRKKGIGTRLAQKAMHLVQGISKGQEIMALPNKNSAGIVHKLGFITSYKSAMPNELRQGCQGCPEEHQFPACHCDTLVWPNGQVIIQSLDMSDTSTVQQVAQFYCQVWQEPPWLEFFWKPEKVYQQILNYQQHQYYKWLVAKTSGQVVGFAASFVPYQDKISQVIPGVSYEGKAIGYAAEMAVNSELRLQGWGTKLFDLMLQDLKQSGSELVLGRTKAVGMEKILQQAGFVQTTLHMPGDPERFYWQKVM